MTAGLTLFYSADLDTADWSSRYERGEVPDRWPYGLDRIPGATAAPNRAAEPWSLPERVLRKFDGRYDWRVRAPRDTATACWDERTGIPAALTRRGSAPLASGVLWLTDQPHTGLAARLTRRGLHRCDALWVNSSAQLEPLRRDWGIPDSRLDYFPMGVDEQFWTPAAPAVDADAEADADTVIVIGNDRDRDHPAAIRAVDRARQARPGIRLSLLTHHPIEVPPELGEREARVRHDELVTRYRRASVVVLALRHNLHCSGITSALEAMACGRPVVVSAAPGMADYIDDGVTGLLVPMGDEQAMTDAIVQLVSDPEGAERMGRAARAAVEQRFTTARLASRIATLVGIGERRSGGRAGLGAHAEGQRIDLR